jgi:hypothetical protein
VDLVEGRADQAYRRAAAALQHVRAVPAGDDYQSMRTGTLRFALRATTRAALRTGRPAEAEAMARELMALPVTQRRPEDPQDVVSTTRTLLAHALALQGRGAEARTLIAPDVERYAAKHEAGGRGLTFTGDYAYALYVDAIASDDAAVRARRLDEAERALGALSVEARQLLTVRELERWIGAARVSST